MSDLSNLSLMEMFREELAGQSAALERDLLALEQTPGSQALIDALMRASHSIKGAARVVQLDALVQLAHAMEDAFSQRLLASLDPLFAAVDAFKHCATLSEEPMMNWLREHADELQLLAQNVRAQGKLEPQAAPQPAKETTRAGAADDALRVTADHLTTLMELGGQVMVDAGQMDSLGDSMRYLRLRFDDIADRWDDWERQLAGGSIPTDLDAMRSLLADYRIGLRRALSDYDRSTRRLARVSSKLYHQLGAIRMRPFAEGVQGMARMVRDLAQTLHKQVELRLEGARTQVDRDILARLDAPLTHLVRNAIDHGIEPPEVRRAAGKPEAGTVELRAWHRAGRLHITVRDDGCGIHLGRLRGKIVEHGLADEATAAALNEHELLEFLFLPGFSTAGQVTEISGRGVGLDVVKTMVQGVGGVLRVHTGQGTTFHLELPLTLSVVRMLLFEVGGAVWALPLAKVERVLPAGDEPVWQDEPARAVDTATLLGVESSAEAGPSLLLRRGEELLALRVERLRGERELVVRPVDGRFAPFRPLVAWSLLDDGSTVLVLDAGELTGMATGEQESTQSVDVLVVDDSPTVRKMLAGILAEAGLQVREADDGQAAWSLLQTTACRLLVSDLDMPNMDGLELVKRLKAEPRLAATPVIMVSYRDTAVDRLAAITAGVDYYLDKGTFQRDMFMLAVRDLLGDDA